MTLSFGRPLNGGDLRTNLTSMEPLVPISSSPSLQLVSEPSNDSFLGYVMTFGQVSKLTIYRSISSSN